jgi:transposase-like protein
MKRSTLTAEQHAHLMSLLGTSDSHAQLASRVGCGQSTVRYWRRRYQIGRMDGITDMAALCATSISSEAAAKRLGVPLADVVAYRRAYRRQRKLEMQRESRAAAAAAAPARAAAVVAPDDLHAGDDLSHALRGMPFPVNCSAPLGIPVIVRRELPERLAA